MSNSIAIIGMGRFGSFFANMLARTSSSKIYSFDPRVRTSDPFDQRTNEKQRSVTACESLAQCVQNADWIFICVPIGLVRDLLAELSPLLDDHHLLIDTCSVKEQPAQWMSQMPNTKVSLIATHPLFGPDSYKETTHPYIVTHPLRVEPRRYNEFLQFLKNLGLCVVEMDPHKHDKEIAMTQGLTHFVGRILSSLNLQDSAIGTEGFRQLHKLVRQTCNDTEELFFDMHRYNSHSDFMLNSLYKAFDEQREKIERVKKER